MNRNQIKKLRKKISKKGYWDERWDLYSKKCKEWNDFWRWECRSFFVGEERARRNQYKYNKFGERDIKKCYYYERKAKEMKEQN